MVEARFIVSLQNVRIHKEGAIIHFFRRSCKVQAQFKTIKRPRFVIVNIEVQSIEPIIYVLISSNTKVVPHYRRGELEHVSRFVIYIGELAIAFDHVVVSRLFLKATYSHIMELGRNARYICIA